MKQYGIYGQAKDGCSNGYWLHVAAGSKEFIEEVARRSYKAFDWVVYEVRELPSPNGANQS